MSSPAQTAFGPRASRIEALGSVADINDYFHERGWTDGLPIIPPTEDLVLNRLEAAPVLLTVPRRLEESQAASLAEAAVEAAREGRWQLGLTRADAAGPGEAR